MTATPPAKSPAQRPLGRFRWLLIAVPAAFVVGPYLIPLPRTPSRSAVDVAAGLGQGGRLVEALGTRAWVEEAGPADGPPVVLVHGFGGSGWSWRETLPALARAGHRAVAIDLANFGLSDKGWRLDSSHAGQADLVAAVMGALGIERAALVGHSMGADVVAWLAVRHPGCVSGAVLVDAATGPADRRPARGAAVLLRLPNVRRIGQLVFRGLVHDARMGAFLRSAFAEPSRATAETLAGYVAPLQTVDWDLGLLAIARDGDRSRLPLPIGDVLRVPTAIVWGRCDRWIPLSAGEALRAALPDAEWHIIDDAGHLPMHERPDAFNDILLSWLERTR